jgi:serine protease Do
MKKVVSTAIAGFFGALVALTGTHFIFDTNKDNSIQIRDHIPQYNMVNYSGTSVAGGSNDFTNAAEKTVNSVVHIKTISQQVNNLSYDPFAELFFGPQRRQQNFELHGSGSGVIISEDGYIVTNNHVVAGSDKIEVTLNDKRTYEAELIGADASTDVALVKIKLW